MRLTANPSRETLRKKKVLHFALFTAADARFCKSGNFEFSHLASVIPPFMQKATDGFLPTHNNRGGAFLSRMQAAYASLIVSGLLIYCGRSCWVKRVWGRSVRSIILCEKGQSS